MREVPYSGVARPPDPLLWFLLLRTGAHMRSRLPVTPFILIAIIAIAGSFADAETEQEREPLFAEPRKNWVWDEDKRFDFLMERLASLEASLDAINAAIAKSTGKRFAKQSEARRHDENNSMMDRKAGGPMRWSEFYGTNAEKFFYHPIDPNTTYHTSTALRQMGGAEDDKVGNGVPASQSVPAHQRPPQWDYIYRANRDAKSRAEDEARKLEGKISDLTDRRYQLEQEQADLWARLAFRVIERHNIARKPVLRFQLIGASTSPEDVEEAIALQAAAQFLSTALLIIDKAEEDQATALTSIRDIVSSARDTLDDTLLEVGSLSGEVSDRSTSLGKYVALAQLLDDTSNNLGESYEVAMDGDRANDEARKDRFRGLLQKSLVEYAEILLALDEIADVMKSEWQVAVNTKSKVAPVNVEWSEPVRLEKYDGSKERGGSSDQPHKGSQGVAVGGRQRSLGSRSGVRDQRDEVDMLSKLDLARNAVMGQWVRRVDGSVAFDSSGSPNGILLVPVKPAQEDYDLLVEVEVTGGARHVVLYVASGGTTRFFILEPFRTQNIEYTPNSPLDLSLGKKHEIQVHVRSGDVSVSIGGETVGSASIASMGRNSYWDLRHDGCFGLGAHDTALVFHKFVMRKPKVGL
jgi:hypothetical protein